MATLAKKQESYVSPPGYKYVTRAEGKVILDRQARKYLGMSGEEFLRKYRGGEIEDPDRSAVIRVAILIPLAET